MRIIASLLGLVPVMAFVAPLGGQRGAAPDVAGTYSDCQIASLLPDVPPESIVISQSLGGGVNDVVINPGAGSIVGQVSNTFIADGIARNMFVQEFGVPVGATRMCEFDMVSGDDRLLVEQTDDLFGTIVEREIELLFRGDTLEYSVAFGPFIIYRVICDRE